MDKDSSLTIWLEEYKVVREETKFALQYQQNILSWSSVAVGVLLIFALNLWKADPLLTLGFFLIVLPSASLMFLNIWLTEVARMARAGRYLFLIENKLQLYLSDNSLSLFEHWLLEKDLMGRSKNLAFGYKSGIAIYLGIVAFAHIVSNIILWMGLDKSLVPFSWKIVFSCSSILFNASFILSTRRRVKRFILEV